MTDPDRRRRDLAQIHIAAKQLGMDTKDPDPESEYHAMLWSVARVRSSADLDYTGLQRVLAHLRACGFKPRHGKRPRVPADRTAQIRKIEALLTDAGLPWEYLTAGANGKPSMLKRICRVEKLEWANAEQLGKLIAALSYNQARRGGRKA